MLSMIANPVYRTPGRLPAQRVIAQRFSATARRMAEAGDAMSLGTLAVPVFGPCSRVCAASPGTNLARAATRPWQGCWGSRQHRSADQGSCRHEAPAELLERRPSKPAGNGKWLKDSNSRSDGFTRDRLGDTGRGHLVSPLKFGCGATFS
jgi:hypothetical protein